MMTPNSRPQQTEAKTRALLEEAGVRERVALLGMRGYYSRTFAPDGNNRGVYDDAVFLVTPDGVRAFNFNTDPGAYRQGIATLRPGVWRYKQGIHGLSKPANRRYPALVQAGEVTVSRDGERAETGYFGINIHRGGAGSTSSLGCQTLPPDQWAEFFGAVCAAMNSAGQKSLPYVLVEVTP